MLIKSIVFGLSFAIATALVCDVAYAADPQMANAQQRAIVSGAAQETLRRLSSVMDANVATVGEVNPAIRRKSLSRDVAKVIDSIREPEVLGLVARLSSVIAYPQNAETVRHDEV